MSRLLITLGVMLCALNLNGALSTGCGPGGPTATLTVDSTTYTNFAQTGTSNGCTLSGIFGSIATTGYVVTIKAFTAADPVIDFGMNFEGSPSDPNVSLTISTPYIGGPFASLFTSSSGILSDTDNNGSASVTPQSGIDIQTVKVNGSPIFSEGIQNPGCAFSGQPAGFSQACPDPRSQQLFGSFPATGTLELDLAFTLSAGDSYNVSGAVFTPEPATSLLLAGGLVALIGLGRRHSQ
jgi:hypothetical protein